jgi:methionine-rich copper-binding protein CopC
MRWFRQHWLSHVARALPLAVLALALGAAAVLAHANAVRSAPAADAVLVDAPGDLAVWFDEAVDLRQSGIKLLDRSGQVLVEGRGSPTGERNSVGVALPPLGPGTYTAVWDNVAVDDGHANAGYYSFSVGRRDPALVITPAGESRSGSAGTISYRITPQDDGSQRFEVAALDSRGAPLGAVQRVMLRARLQQPSAGPATVDAAPAANGLYAVTSGLVSVAGPYELEIVVRRRRADDLTARFALQAALPSAASAPPRTDSDSANAR